MPSINESGPDAADHAERASKLAFQATRPMEGPANHDEFMRVASAAQAHALTSIALWLTQGNGGSE